MKSKKMSEQVKMMVTKINDIMKQEHIKDYNHPLFASMSWLLSQAGCYHGFNFFTKDGQLSGGDDNNKFDHVELYIK